MSHRTAAALVLVAAVMVATGASPGSCQEWVVQPSGPVIAPGGSAWDVRAVGQPCARLEKDAFRMWYTGAGSDWQKRILLAESHDGVTWTRRQAPALDVGAPGSWDAWAVDTPEVVRTPVGWHLYYFGQRDSSVIEGSAIGLATSSDGVTFTRLGGAPVLSPGPPGSWDERWVESPAVDRDPVSGRWVMLYSGINAAWQVGLGVATSVDGVTWQKDPSNPVLAPSVGPAWDDYWVAVATIVRWRSLRWAFYSGVSADDLADGSVDDPRIGFAWSGDGSRWQKGSGGPQLAGAWAPSVVQDQERQRLLMWFEAPDGIHLAVRPFPTLVHRPGATMPLSTGPTPPTGAAGGAR